MSPDPSPQIETVLQEQRVFEPSSLSVGRSHINGFEQYQKMVEAAKLDPERFWGDAALKELHWFNPFHSVLDWSNPPFAKWFEGGKTNLSTNCLDRHLDSKKADKEEEGGEQKKQCRVCHNRHMFSIDHQMGRFGGCRFY